MLQWLIPRKIFAAREFGVGLILFVFILGLAGFPARGVAQDLVNPSGEGKIGSADIQESSPFDDEMEDLVVSDPIEPFNRAMFWINDKLYFYLLKPVARGYRIVPESVRVSVSNVFSNLGTPSRFVNALLQGKGDDAGREMGRFLINTTYGICGLWDVAKAVGVERKEEDLGQTFGYYGAGEGFYLVLPLFGPSNLRDGLGRIGDQFLDPVGYAITRDMEYLGVKAFDNVNSLSLDKDTYEGIKNDSLDPYSFIKNAYSQRREALIKK